MSKFDVDAVVRLAMRWSKGEATLDEFTRAKETLLSDIAALRDDAETGRMVNAMPAGMTLGHWYTGTDPAEDVFVVDKDSMHQYDAPTARAVLKAAGIKP